MLKPTQDKEARKQVADFFAKKDNTTIEKSKGTVGEHFYYEQADEILTIIEQAGYYKGDNNETKP